MRIDSFHFARLHGDLIRDVIPAGRNQRVSDVAASGDVRALQQHTVRINEVSALLQVRGVGHLKCAFWRVDVGGESRIVRRALIHGRRVRHRHTISGSHYVCLCSFRRGTVRKRRALVSLLIDDLECFLDTVSWQLVCRLCVKKWIGPILQATCARHVSRRDLDELIEHFLLCERRQEHVITGTSGLEPSKPISSLVILASRSSWSLLDGLVDKDGSRLPAARALL